MSTKQFLAQIGLQLVSIILAAFSLQFNLAFGQQATIKVDGKYSANGIERSLWDCDSELYSKYKSECYCWKYLYASVIAIMTLLCFNTILMIIRQCRAQFIILHLYAVRVTIVLLAILAIMLGVSAISAVYATSNYFTVEISAIVLLSFVQLPIIFGIILEFNVFQKMAGLLDDYD